MIVAEKNSRNQSNMRKENCQILPSNSISKIKGKKEYFRNIFEILSLKVTLNKTRKKIKMTSVTGTDETMKANPEFYIKLSLSQPSLYFLSFLKSRVYIIDCTDVPRYDKTISDMMTAQVPFQFKRLMIPLRKTSQL